MSLRNTILGIALGFVLVAPAAAEESAGSPARKKRDPNALVCERQEVLGSRLKKRKVCMTRAQWAEQRRSDRDLVHQSQVNTTLKPGF